MSRIKILIDMNLSPQLVDELSARGIRAVHWSKIGAHDASDCEIMNWARSHGYVLLTHDLDFGAMLSFTKAEGPSIIQVRTLDVRPQIIAPKIAKLINKFERQLMRGAIVVLDDSRERVRLLPLV